jgi:PAS domain S-box-containing protein
MPETLTSPKSHSSHGSPLDSEGAAPVPQWEDIGHSEHFVSFYENDGGLVESVSEFFHKGLKQGEVCIVIATESHRNAIRNKLESKGLDMGLLQTDGRYVSLDAAEALREFMVDASPDRSLFLQSIGSTVARAVHESSGVRAFGEMVALLWDKGNSEGAIKLEELWNDLAKSYSFALFCGYPMSSFQGEEHRSSFEQICQAHTHVIPSESYSRKPASENDRLRVISGLQQKALSLEAEIAVRKEVEKALTRRERELTDFLENATEGIHKVDSNGKILWANKAEMALLGYRAGEYIGRIITEFHVDAEVIDDMMSRLKRGEQLHDYEARLRHKDGSIKFVAVNSSGHWDGDQFKHTKCFTRDITARKLTAEMLEKQVEARTAEYKEVVEELESFSYSISHDLRSPLRAMQAYSTALLEDYKDQLDEEGRDYLRRIQRSATRMDLLIRDVLCYSQVAKSEIKLNPVNLKPLVTDLLQQFDIPRAASMIIVEDLPFVWGHEAYLTQSLSNLISNGLKFIEPGTNPRLRIWSEIDGEMARICVSDNGIGIDPEHRSRVFKMFGRIHSDKRFPGTGIGLAIVNKAAARMGGTAGFESKPGKGSTFWLLLRRYHGS